MDIFKSANKDEVLDVVLDTDAYNEIDDQYAIAYLIKSANRLSTKAIYAAPFHNEKSISPKDGMEKSFEEILNVLDLMNGKEVAKIVYKGASCFLEDEKNPAMSDACINLVELSKDYSSKKPLYVIG